MAKDWQFPNAPDINPENCAYCIGDSNCRKPDGTLMTSKEWCAEMNTCAATIDWDRLYERSR